MKSGLAARDVWAAAAAGTITSSAASARQSQQFACVIGVLQGA
jgi:hypothetical protein